MQGGIDEACEAVEAVAAGKGRAAIRRMLIAELKSRDVDTPPPEVVDLLVEQIAAGSYQAGKPFTSVRYSGLSRLPFVRKYINKLFGPTAEEFESLFSAGGMITHGVLRVTDHVADDWPTMPRLFPHPPGRELYAPAPADVPPPARLLLDPDVHERMPEIFDPPPPPPRLPGMPPPTGADLILVWLEDDNGTVTVCCAPGRLGILAAEDAEAYLPLVRSVHAQGKVVATTADVRRTAHDPLAATIRVIPHRSEPA